MKQLAFLIGNGAYPESPLSNPTNDAVDLTAKLVELGFEANYIIDTSVKEMDVRLREFGVKLAAGYEVGLFFFAGHGMQIEGVNYLTAVDTDFSREVDAQYSSLALNKVIDTMAEAGTRLNILILDACRTNPYERRWRTGASRGLAPVYAPKGMIVAYATSPGQVALDGFGRNGAYTSAVLQHIGQQNVTIETFFKRVRNTVSSSTGGRQISWEHTSLMGEYYFNNSLANVAGVTGYSDAALADGSFGPLNGEVGEIIANLKTHNWYRQNPAVARVTPVALARATKDECFVLGRNLYQAACGGANSANAFISDLKASLAPLPETTGFHVLNGILFEIFFDNTGRFRAIPKTGKIDEVFALEENEQYATSIRFLQEKLLPYRERLFYFPGSQVQACFDAVLVNHKDQPALEQICFEGDAVLYQDGVGYFVLSQGSYLNADSKDALRGKIGAAAAVPSFRLKVSYVGPAAAAETFLAPWRIDLRRNAPTG